MNYFLKNEIVKNENLTSEGLLVYVTLVKMTDNKIPKVYTNISLLEYAIKDDDNSSRAFKDKIKNGLLNLVDNDIIKVKGIIDKNNSLTIDVSKFRINTDSENYVIIKESEINKITTCNEKGYEPDKCLKYLINILMTLNNKSFVGYTSIDMLAERTGINRNTAMRYNNLLEILDILYIHRVDKIIRSTDGFVKKINNTYARVENKELAIKESDEYINGFKFSGSLSGDEKRSIKQKYNAFMKKYNSGYKFTQEEINIFNEMVKQYNYSYKNASEVEKLKEIENLLIINKRHCEQLQ